ncbi:LuxR C-terminal-related transcriptional regulator [Siphonobacter sp.]|uniref:helix-turn-helix transcriptional regulator n=1 Tax=Siphonobacter sp. TaxID=1869184 RepID=UPI003B3BAFE3
MTLLAIQAAKEIWQKVAHYQEASPLDVALELQIHRKLLNVFQVGPYYYYFFNVSTGEIEHTSDSVQKVLGCTPEEFSVPYAFAHMHPDDLPYFINFERKVSTFFGKLTPSQALQYKVSYDFRIRRTDGGYVRILHQVVTLEVGAPGSVLRTLGIHTDISMFKSEGIPTLSFIGMEGQPSYLNVATDSVGLPSKPVLTLREKQILSAIMLGKASKQIADLFSITKETVDRHRKNMLEKTNTHSTAELVAKALQAGWV